MTTRSVTLRETRDELGTRHLGAKLSADGTLSIEGQELGDGVEQFFGSDNREYEWIWTIRPKDVARLAHALDAGDDVLTALAERFAGGAAAGLQQFLDEQGIRYESWSRIGD